MNKYLIILEMLQDIGYIPYHLSHAKNNIYEYNQLITYMYKIFIENNTFSYIPKAKVYNSADLVIFKNNNLEYLQFKYKLNKTFSLDKINNLYDRYISNSYTNKLILSTYNEKCIEMQKDIIIKYNNDHVIFQDSLNETNKIVSNIDDFKEYMLKHKKMWESTNYQKVFKEIEDNIKNGKIN